MNYVVSVKDISKCYKIYPSRKARLKEWLLPFIKCHKEKWVLKNISFNIEQGEAIGIIGLNGAGKSTLLKIITGTVIPTTGRVNFNGRVSALLELGLGFHPDFTGRQNVYMAGQLLGYTEREITECMQQIEDFAEIGEAIDAPVRTYSSGMQVRLAFSVATMKKPDILIVDEALSVGDAYFQHKSFDRIKKYLKLGMTLLLVSHDKSVIQSICNKAILLGGGGILKEGCPEDIMNYYNAMLAQNDSTSVYKKDLVAVRGGIASGNRDIEVESVKIFVAGKVAKVLSVGDVCNLVVCGIANKDVENVTCGVMIKNRLGEEIYGTNTYLHKKDISALKKGERLKCSFEFSMDIGVGNYSVTVAFHKKESHVEGNYEWVDFAEIFQVVNSRNLPFNGNVYLPTKVYIEV